MGSIDSQPLSFQEGKHPLQWKSVIHNVPITIKGLKYNEYSGFFGNLITLEEIIHMMLFLAIKQMDSFLVAKYRVDSWWLLRQR